MAARGNTSGQPVLDSDDFYHNPNYPEGKNVGRAMIINNEKIVKTVSNKTFNREVSEKDIKAIECILKKMNFCGVKTKDEGQEVKQIVFRNVTKERLMKIMECAAAEMDKSDLYNDYGCFLCILMSYGEPGVIYCESETGNNVPCEIKELQEPFKNHKCKVMAAKPKIFLIQACPYEERAMPCGGDTETSVETTRVKIPRESDFLTHFSSQPGFLGWKNGTSQYVTALVKTLEEYHTGKHRLNFLKMLTRINNSMVKDKSESDDDDIKDFGLEVPLVTSTLTKHIILKRTEQVQK